MYLWAGFHLGGWGICPPPLGIWKQTYWPKLKLSHYPPPPLVCTPPPLMKMSIWNPGGYLALRIREGTCTVNIITWVQCHTWLYMYVAIRNKLIDEWGTSWNAWLIAPAINFYDHLSLSVYPCDHQHPSASHSLQFPYKFLVTWQQIKFLRYTVLNSRTYIHTNVGSSWCVP